MQRRQVRFITSLCTQSRGSATAVDPSDTSWRWHSVLRPEGKWKKWILVVQVVQTFTHLITRRMYFMQRLLGAPEANALALASVCVQQRLCSQSSGPFQLRAEAVLGTSVKGRGPGRLGVALRGKAVPSGTQ